MCRYGALRSGGSHPYRLKEEVQGSVNALKGGGIGLDALRRRNRVDDRGESRRDYY
ncbi:hypothetical protein [Thermosporothrix hazakensis]|uniref:hypothetical protein n=1 Tax=Thermosporothrix hazakensis TaxID=644383 RepID=UPI001475B11B|nr:hypothetical protein [Thermosporothrix hazakensis]